MVTKIDKRIRGHMESLKSLQEHQALGSLLYGIIPANEDISYSYANHQSVMQFNPRTAVSRAYAQMMPFT